MCTLHQEGIFYFAPDKKVLRISTIVVNIYLKTINCEASGEYPTIALNTVILGNCLSGESYILPALPLSYPFSYGGGYGANLFCACYFQHFGTLRKRGTGGLYVVCKKYCFAVKI